MKNLRYIGKKPQKDDNVAGTGVVWNGQGDVQAVSDGAASKLLAHTGVWELAIDMPDAPADDAKSSDADAVAAAKKLDEQNELDSKPPMANLESMDKAALKDFAQRHFNHAFHPNAGEKGMRNTIIGLMNRG